MIISVDTRFLSRSKIEAVAPVTWEVLQAMTSEHPEDHFYFFSDREATTSNTFPANVTSINLPLHGPANLGRKYWLNVALPKALKQYRVEALLSPDGEACMRTRVPQLLVWKHKGPAATSPSALTRFLWGDSEKKYIGKAHTLLVASPDEKELLTGRWRQPADRVHVIGTTVSNAFQPADAATRDEVKSRYASGREYFMCLDEGAGMAALVTLLKAFSLFKKRQRSSWKLVLPGAFASGDKHFTDLLRTYRYKEDIVLPGVVDQRDTALLVASSYAAIAAGTSKGETLCAMKCGVPCLAQPGGALIYEQQGGLLPIDMSDPAPIAEALMLIYKDETLHARLVGEALLSASTCTPQKTAGLVWQSLLECTRTTA
jgi:hypothetical protein